MGAADTRLIIIPPGLVTVVETAMTAMISEMTIILIFLSNIFVLLVIDKITYFLASNTRLKGVSAARLNSEKPPESTTSFMASSLATAPSAGPPSAIEFAVQQ